MPLPDQPTPSKFSSKLARMGCVSFCLSQANKFDFSYKPHITLCIFDFSYTMHCQGQKGVPYLTFLIPSYRCIVDHQTGYSKSEYFISPTSLSWNSTFVHIIFDFSYCILCYLVETIIEDIIFCLYFC